MDSVIRTSDTIDLLVAALAKAQGVMQGAAKDSANPFFKSKYADLASVWDACREPLTSHGLAVLQGASSSGPTVSVETRIAHVSGQWMASTLTATGKDDSPQVIGSLVTYLRRYGLQTVAGVCPTDDDAEAAQPRGGTAATVEKLPAGFADWLDDLRATEPARRRETLLASKPEYQAHFAQTNQAASAKILATVNRETGEERGE